MDQKILERFFKGECSPEEHDRVVGWYLSGEADDVLSARIEVLWKRENMIIGDEWGKEAVFEAITCNIDKSAKEKKRISLYGRSPGHYLRWRQWWYGSVAALLIVGICWWWYYHLDEVSPPTVKMDYIAKETASGEKRSFVLEDGTMVKLNAESRLWYSEAFGKDSIREVFLEGEAFFDVARDTLHPFQIHTGHITTTVLGTSFNVKAFASDEDIAVSVVSGEVQVGQLKGKQVVNLQPGEQALYSKKDTVIAKNTFDYQQVLSWQKGTLYFKDARFSEIVNALERWYGVEIDVQRQDIEDGFSGAYSHKSLESVLDGMSFVLNFEYEINGKKIIIK